MKVGCLRVKIYLNRNNAPEDWTACIVDDIAKEVLGKYFWVCGSLGFLSVNTQKEIHAPGSNAMFTSRGLLEFLSYLRPILK